MMDGIPLSAKMLLPATVIVPVMNDEKNLSRCLSRLEDFKEVFVVDSGSTDGSREVAVHHGARIVDFQWDGKFPKKRNWCLRNLAFQTEWVLFLDADEYIDERFKAELRKTLPTTECNGFWISYDNWFAGRLLRHGDKMRKLALLRVGSGEYEHIDEERWSSLDMEIHEHPMVQGRIGKLETPVEHRGYKGLTAYIERHNDYSSWEARRFLKLRREVGEKLTLRQRVKYALLDTVWLAPLYFLWTYFLKCGFLDGRSGFFFAGYKAAYFLQIKGKIDEFRDSADNST